MARYVSLHNMLRRTGSALGGFTDVQPNPGEAGGCQ
ncbi:MAG: hypothetical protein BWX84_00168 [Verrucomicrobia bacterium ADurb.Bin118]|nr:MAG: hypothetical protein BWX84_00168 [Verrucomicrobia bacterium ADurb.Bin118]